MGLRSRHDPVDSSPRASFGTTHWSIVLAAKGHGTPEARQALAAICDTYWYPLYAFVRRKEVGRTVADPNEVEQEIGDLFLALSG